MSIMIEDKLILSFKALQEGKLDVTWEAQREREEMYVKEK